MSAAESTTRSAPQGMARYSDVVLAFGVVAIVALMILPLPLFVIDTLVAVNILCGVGLILLAIYIPRPTAFSAFPSVLLLTTLFRLALSIAITRLILLETDAGHIIDTFGNMVVGGNLVVGLVVFLIITVVQFIVVAKGAERVAEVAARFTLDAMPGKQLSIDSDLRAGLIDKDEARRRRRLLETESQLHGSLDGAMKFVKGDAIAGIVIIIVNLLGGLAIGVIQLDMELGDAVHTYSILTIGDGLVSQIPALLSAIAAGLIVTRSGGEEDDPHLGAAISRQIAAQPRVAVIGGVLSLLLTLVPGFPWPVFLLLGIALLGPILWRSRSQLTHAPTRQLLRLAPLPVVSPTEVEAPAPALAAPADSALPAPLILEIDADVLSQIDRLAVSESIQDITTRIRDELGVPLPVCSVRSWRAASPRGGYRLVAHGVRIAIGELKPDQHYLPAPEAPPSPQALRSNAPQTLAAPRFQPALPGEWIAAASRPGSLDGAALLARHADSALRRQLSLFLGIQEASNLINRWAREYPDLVKEMLRVVPPQRVSDVLKRLVDEGIPVRNLRDIFEAIADAGSREKDIVMLTEYVRVALKRQISDRFAGPDRSLRALLAHPELEDHLRQSVRGGAGGGQQVAIDPELLGRVLGELREARTRLGRDFASAALLCGLDVRRHLRRLVEHEFFDLPVLSFQELVSEIQVTPVGQVRG